MKTTVFYHNTSTQRWSVKITVKTQWLDEDNSVLPQHHHSTMECKDNSGDTVVGMKTTVFYHNTSTQRWSVKITVKTQWLDEDNSVLPQHLHSTMETTVFYHNTSTQRWSVKITVETQ